MDFAFFSMQKFVLFLMVLVRTGGIFTLTPMFGAQQVPPHVRMGMALALTAVFVPVVPVSGHLPMDLMQIAMMGAREACVGIVIGFVCSLVFSTIQIAGQFVDFQSGLAFAAMVDPINGANSAVAGRFQNLIAGLLFFATNAHHMVIRGLSDSFVLAPIGQLEMNPAAAGGIVDLFTGLFAIAIRIAMPICAAVFLADVALGIVARVVPQMNVLVVGLPLKLGVAVAAMVVALPVLGLMSRGLFGDMYQQMGIVVRQFAAY